MRKAQFYVPIPSSRRGLDRGMNVKSEEKMGKMYSRDWVTLSDNYAEGRAKEEGVPSASSGVP